MIDISSIHLTEAEAVAARLTREGITLTLRLRLEPAQRVTPELEKAVHQVAPELRYLLAKQAIEDLLVDRDEQQPRTDGNGNGHANALPTADLTRCRWCGRDPRTPPSIAEQIKRLRAWQIEQPPVYQWTQAQLDHLSRSMDEGDEIQWVGYGEGLIRKKDGSLVPFTKTDA